MGLKEIFSNSGDFIAASIAASPFAGTAYYTYGMNETVVATGLAITTGFIVAVGAASTYQKFTGQSDDSGFIKEANRDVLGLGLDL